MATGNVCTRENVLQKQARGKVKKSRENNQKKSLSSKEGK